MADKTKEPLVSIVILNWNGLEDTKTCLNYVNKLDYSNYEIIVVDNGSSKSEKNYLSKKKGIIYVDNPENRGFAGGQADGYRHAKGEFILLLNNDAVIQSDYLKNAIPLFKDPSVAVVGGRSYFWNDEEKLLDTSNRFYGHMDVDPITAETTLNMQDRGVIQEVNVVSGSAVIVRKSVTEKVGYLWEPFFAYYEETDLFARIKRAGYKVLYNPKLHIWHKNGASSGAQTGSLFFFFHIFRNRYMFAARNFDDNYFKLFKQSYAKSMRVALRESILGGVHTTIAKAYIKARKELKKNENQILADREKLKTELKNETYSKMIIEEQLSVSFIFDATNLKDTTVHSLIKKALESKKSPLLEYVFIVNSSYKKQSRQPGVRVVADKNMFTEHPVNLGCIVARNEWIAVISKDEVGNTQGYLSALTDSFTSSAKVIKRPNENTLLFKKSFFELVGGVGSRTGSLKSHLAHLVKYAQVDKSLPIEQSVIMTDQEVEVFRGQIHSDYELKALNKITRWQKLLNKHYRLFQLNNLVVWGLHPKLPLRLKLGRSKNIILATISLNKKSLATELKHMRNEVLLQDKVRQSFELREKLHKESDKFTKNQIKDPRSIPVFIITFERVNDLKRLVKSLESLGQKNIIFIDNGSTYSPLLEYLDKTPYQVIPLGQNVGHTAPWSQSIIRSLIPLGFYIVTDPDVLPTTHCIESSPIERMLKVHDKYPVYHKVGLSLKIDDLPDHYPLKQSVINWEQQFWENTLEDNVYEASVDTTFALYKPTTYTYLLGPSIRLGEPFSAQHVPWYSNPANPTAEDTYYKNRANSEVTSWNVDELPERYKKELERASK